MRGNGLFAAIGLLALLAAPALADDAPPAERVTFAPGASGTSISGRITGGETAKYLLAANADQLVTVSLDTDNGANTFTITAPGAATPMFTGTDNADRFEGPVPVSGDYLIDVYLTDKAAGDGETANYTITISVSGIDE